MCRLALLSFPSDQVPDKKGLKEFFVISSTLDNYLIITVSTVFPLGTEYFLSLGVTLRLQAGRKRTVKLSFSSSGALFRSFQMECERPDSLEFILRYL